MRLVSLSFSNRHAFAALAGSVAAAAAVIVAACSNSPTPTTDTDSGAPPFDGSTSGPDTSTPPADAGPADVATSLDAAADVDSAPPFDGGPVTIITTIPLAGPPSAMAFNAATNTLYVALAASADGGAGIAVISGTTNTVQTTIANPGDDAAAGVAISAMAVDTVSNTIYAAASAGETLYVIDGASSTVTATIPLASDPFEIQVDSLAHVAYVLGTGTAFIPDGGTNSVSPATVTAVSGADASVTTVELDDLSNTPAPTLALDQTLHHLFVCGANALQWSNVTADLAAVDTLDTHASLAAVGTQQSFGAASEVACAAGWGGGAIVTAASPGVDFFNPSSAPLPAAFLPQGALGAGSSGAGTVVTFGYDLSSSNLEVAAVSLLDAGATITVAPSNANLGTGKWTGVVESAASGGTMRAYLTYGAPGDGGSTVPASSVAYASIHMD